MSIRGCTAMKKFLAVLFTVSSLSLGVEIISDPELEEVYAGTINQIIQDNIKDNIYSGIVTRSASGGGSLGGGPFDLVNSVFIDGNAQQGSFAPINAANSAVSQAINLVIIMGDVTGDVDIDFNNNLNSNLSVVQ